MPGSHPREPQGPDPRSRRKGTEKAFPVAPVSACTLVPPLGLQEPRDTSWGGLVFFSSLAICQKTGDPGAVLWLEEIRQGVARANEDTNTAQRSKEPGSSSWALGGEGGAQQHCREGPPPHLALAIQSILVSFLLLDKHHV